MVVWGTFQFHHDDLCDKSFFSFSSSHAKKKQILSWIANEIIVKQLAENRSFQRLAVKIDSTLNSKKDVILKYGEELKKTGTEALKKNQATTTDGFDIKKFMLAFKDEVKKDFSKK